MKNINELKDKIKEYHSQPLTKKVLLLTLGLILLFLITACATVQAATTEVNSYTVTGDTYSYYNYHNESLYNNGEELDQTFATCLSKSGNDLYYIGGNDGKIYKLSDEDKETLVDDKCSNLIVTDNSIYYINNGDGKIYKANLDGENQTVVNSKKTKSFILNGKTIYFSTGKILYSLTGSKLVKLDSAFGYIDSINLYKDKLYYIKDSNLYKSNTDGKKIIKLNNSLASFMRVYNGYIYYVNDNDEGANIYRCQISGVKVKKIFEGITNQNTNTYGDYLVDHIDVENNHIYIYTKSGIGYISNLDGSNVTNIDGSSLTSEDDEE